MLETPMPLKTLCEEDVEEMAGWQDEGLVCGVCRLMEVEER